MDSLERRRLLATVDLLVNGALADPTGWTLTGHFSANAAFSSTNGRSNPGYGYLSAADGSLTSSNNLVGTLSQSVTIPASATSALFTFWYKHSTNDAVAASDSLAVRVKNSAGTTTLATLATQYNQTNATYLQAGPFDLSSYAGQTVRISFDGQTGATGPSVFRVDDASLTVDVPDALVAPVPQYPGHPSRNAAPNYPIASLSPGFKWNPVAGATGYGMELQRSTDGGTTWVAQFNSETSFGGAIPGAYASVPSSTVAGLHRWRVRAFNGASAGTYSAWMYTNVTAPGTRAVGIDVSKWQGSGINWTSVKNAGISFAFTKATQGTTINDATFGLNMDNARTAGVPIGGYHFPDPDASPGDAVAEAQFFYNAVKSRLFAGNMRPMLDMEVAGSLTGKAAISAWAVAFCAEFVRLSGIAPIIYAGQYFASVSLDASVIKYPIWIARYPSGTVNEQTDVPGSTTPWNTWHFWQYTDEASVGGINPVDKDIFNGSAAALEAYKLSNVSSGSITGTLYRDADDDGALDAGEAPLAARTVWLDLDDDGTIDPGEPSAATNASGGYAFTGLKPGGYVVRQVVPAGWIVTNPSLPANASPRYALVVAAATQTANFGTRPSDVVPPTVTSVAFDRTTSPQTLRLTFSEDVSASLASPDVQVQHDGTEALVDVTFAGYAAGTNVATFALGSLSTGTYSLALLAGAVSDAWGNVQPAAQTGTFAYVVGDVDGDLAVNFNDLLALAQNYGGSPRTIAQGDLDYDGTVNFNDLLLLAQHYGNSLPTTVPAAAPTSVSTFAVTGRIVAPTCVRPDDDEADAILA